MNSNRHGRRQHASPRQWHQGLMAAFASGQSRFAALTGFMFLVALTGGGSRADIQSLIVLRPAAVMFATYALLVAAAADMRSVRMPLVVVASLMLLALLQLVPLPWTVWTHLPQREAVAEASTLVGMGNLARPISLDPNRTWNTFFSLFVPFAAVCLTAVQTSAFQRLIVPLLIAIGLLSAAVGLLQTIGGNGLQFYQVSHRGFPVGLFANKNHQAVLLLWVMLATSWLTTTADPRRHSPAGVMGGVVALILVLFPLLILTGSRAGLFLVLPALPLCAFLLLRAPAAKRLLKRTGSRAKVAATAVAAVVLLPLLGVFGVLLMSNRQTALSRLFEVEATEELRWQYMPILQRMALDHMPFGSGFGSFEKVFNSYEPAEMLSSRYMNQAHNDLMQIVIEGGVLGGAILVVSLAWFVRALLRVRRSVKDETGIAIFLAGSIALWLAASLVDYPLRTPFAAALGASLTAWLSLLSTRHQSGPSLPGMRRAQGKET